MSANMLERLSTGRSVVIAATTAVAAYLGIMLGTAPTLSVYAEGMAIFDLMPTGYDSAYATTLLDRLGDEGRRYYLTRHLALDAVYPGLLATWLSLTWVYAGRKARLPSKLLRRAWIAPALVAFFDYAENAAVAGLILAHPEVDAGRVQAASLFTLGKSALTTLCFTALLVVGGRVAYLRLSANPRPAARSEGSSRAEPS